MENRNRSDAASSDQVDNTARNTPETPQSGKSSASKLKFEKLSALARAHAASRDWPEAAEAWAEILAYRAYPAHVTAKVTVQYSRALRFAGRADQAFDVTSRALSELGPHIGLEREHAENQAALGDFQAASAYWKDLIEAESAPIFAYQRLAHLYSQEGMLAAALDTLAAGLTSHPQSELLLRSERHIRFEYNTPLPPQESVAEDFVSHLFGDFRVEFGRGTAAAAFRQTPENIHIESMLDFATCYAPAHKTDPIEDCDVYIAWGTASSTPSSMLSDYAAHFRKPYLTMEYGLVSSVGLPSSQATQHAIILSQGPAFCDSTRPTAMEDRLNSPLVFDDRQIARARDCIAKIVEHQITRHNHAPIIDMSQRLRNTGRPRILVVDQPVGDKSVELGLADADTFRRMLEGALAMQDHDILVMLCPPSDPQLGGSRLAEVLDEFPSDRMEIIDYDVNAFSLFGLVDKVFVTTSLVGLEACFAGREVYCFAVPFYAGWGFTRDMVVTPRRHVSRSLEEVFVTYYLTFARYHVPGSQVHELEQLIDHIVALRSAGRPVAGATDVIQQVPRIVMVVPSHRMGASGRYMQNLGEALVRSGSEVLILSEGSTVASVNGVRWATIQFDGFAMAANLRSAITRFAPDIVYMNGVRTRAQRLALEIVALTGARLVNQWEDDDVDVFVHRYDDADTDHLTALDKPSISVAQLAAFLANNDWAHTLKVLADPDFDRWIEPLLRVLTNRLAAAHTAIWKPFARRLDREFGKPTMVIPPVASRHDFARLAPPADERAEILTRHGIHPDCLVFYLGGSVYPYSNDFQVFLRAMNALQKRSSQPLALIIAGKSAVPIREIVSTTLNAAIQVRHLVSPSDAVFLELMRACDICCNPGLETGFNEYRLPSRLVRPMAMGKVVLTCRNGLGESLRHGVDAVVTDGNDPMEWADAMEAALPESARQEMGDHARRFAMDHFDPDKVGQAFQQFLISIMADNKSANGRILGVDLGHRHVADGTLPLPMKSAGLEALRQSGLRHVDCVVHIGAGTGSDVKDYVRLGVQKVILAEADPKSATALAALGDNAGCIEIVNGAVIAEGSKRATLYKIKDRDGAHAAEMSSTCQPSDAMFENGVFSAGGSEKVAAVAISTVLDRIPTQARAEQALLVLEVQGAELDLLQAASLQSRKSIGSIVVRTTGSQLYRGGATEQSIRTYLESAGYGCRIVSSSGDDSTTFIVARRLADPVLP